MVTFAPMKWDGSSSTFVDAIRPWALRLTAIQGAKLTTTAIPELLCLFGSGANSALLEGRVDLSAAPSDYTYSGIALAH